MRYVKCVLLGVIALACMVGTALAQESPLKVQFGVDERNVCVANCLEWGSTTGLAEGYVTHVNHIIKFQVTVDNIMINEVIVNRGHCRGVTDPVAFGYGDSDSITLDKGCEPLEVEFKTSLGDFTFEPAD